MRRTLTTPPPRQGATLVSALVGMFILAAALTIVLQSYLVGSRALRQIAQREAATLALEAHLEALLAGGYSHLPPLGVHVIPAAGLPSLPGVQGRLHVAPGPEPDTRQITAELSWEHASARRQERLTILMAKAGMHP